MSRESGVEHLCGAPLDRRGMLACAMFAGVAAALAACGVAESPTAPGSLTPFTLRLADHPSLSTIGGIALVDAGGSPLAVVRTGTDAFVALSRICPHQGGTIGPSTGGFQCPRHGARFDGSGGWIGGQPTSNMRSYPVTFDAAAGTLAIG